MRHNLIKTKKAQEVMGISFGMIFSIILIVFFIIIAGIAINAFLSWQKETQIGLFIKELQSETEIAFKSENYAKTFNSELPSGVEEVCFINLSSSPKSPNNIEQEVYDYAKKQTHDFQKNLYIYAPTKSYSLKWATIENIDLSQKNPICASVKDGKISINIERKFDYPKLIVSA